MCSFILLIWTKAAEGALQTDFLWTDSKGHLHHFQHVLKEGIMQSILNSISSSEIRISVPWGLQFLNFNNSNLFHFSS